ncbi:multicopper oxidase domain-containing protein [Octadecabacter sp. G9-8]|uniref:Multicopper oxidase domain-containing protein n=1 Tax=Octadecabacter dasysiphoniae TaxID=2909341 RepID=A0ABS9CUJ7_9RHOB|nr:multicopper oxidase domain-containing protein [Octadecabacter dasysiphoniae]MCF2870921.1 multicopper oxidase domain-containing protein [Octadecabacter dasysiphoniae]
MKRFGLNTTRRNFLTLLGSTALAKTISIPSTANANANAPTPFAPPSLMAKTSGTHLADYQASLTAFVNMITEKEIAIALMPTNTDAEKAAKAAAEAQFARLYDTDVTTTMANAVTDVYALSAGSRPAPFANGTLTGKTVYTQSYQDLTNLDDSLSNVGPTMEFIRGEATSVWLENSLSVCGRNPRPEEIGDQKLGFTPHSYDYTNLHTHGLHVAPNAPSDDVLVTVKSSSATVSTHADHSGHGAHMESISATPDTAFPNYYDIDKTHPVGTFWYHPHMHGTVAAQVGPGMAGALLMRSGSLEIDFDEILENQCNILKPNSSGTTQAEIWGDERVIVLQGFESLYSVSDASTPTVDGVFVPDAYYTGNDPSGTTCLDGATVGDAIATTSEMDNSNVQILWVNGTYQPTLTMHAGEILRFRMINATNGQTVIPMFKATGTNTSLPGVYAIGVDGITLLPIGTDDDQVTLPIAMDTGPSTVTAYTDDTEYFEIDYSTSEASDPKKYWTTAELITLAPAQRLDILVKAPMSAGTYQMVGASQDEAPTVVGAEGEVNTSVILNVNVVATPRTLTTSQSLPTMKLFDNSKLPAIEAGAKIERPPMAPSLNASPTATQSQWFGYVGAADMLGTGNFQINGRTFDANLADGAQIILTNDTLTAWELYSSNGPHMMHIHINSFAIHGRYLVDKNSGGSGSFGWPSADQGSWPTPSVTMPYLMPIWRDTVYFDSSDGSNSGATNGGRVLATSYQQDYTGEFVMHCHNLFHEDNGMMHTVQIKPSA